MNNPVDKINIDLFNPFSIKQNIFSPKAKNLPNYDTFIKLFYPNWISHALFSEMDAVKMYPTILNRIRDKEYIIDSISHQDINILLNNLVVMHDDEEEHAKFFNEIIQNFDKSTYYNYDINSVKTDHWNVSLIDTLVHYYVGESYLFVCFYKIYKATTDDSIKVQIKKLLVDESKHNTIIYKILKKINSTTVFDEKHFLNTAKDFRYFNSLFVFDYFKMPEVPDCLRKKDKIILKLVYNNEWQKEFTRYYLKKLHKLIVLFYPHITKDDLARMIYEDEIEWAV